MANILNVTDDLITPHFRLREYANHEDASAIICNKNSMRFYKNMEELRNWFNRPIFITSGTRTQAFNKKVGGVSNSYHLLGLAADWRHPIDFYKMNSTRKNQYLDNIKKKWFDICKKEGVKGSVIFYDTFVHTSWWPDWYSDDKRSKR